MRKFSEREKRVIAELVRGASSDFTYLAINAYGDIFYRKKVEFVFQPNSKLNFYYKEPEIRSKEDIFSVTSDIYEISYLIDYLEKEGLIRHFTVGTSSDKPVNSISGFNKAGLSSIIVNLDPAVGKMLFDNLNYPIYITQTLISLVQNDFKTLEEQTLDEAQEQTRESKRQTLLSYIAVFLALLTLLFSMLQGCKSCSNISTSVDDKTGNLTVPVAGIVNYMKNDIEGKLEATMNNTADIRMLLQDTISVKFTSCSCKVIRIPVRPVEKCLKTVRINICEDTIVSKNELTLHKKKLNE